MAPPSGPPGPSGRGFARFGAMGARQGGGDGLEELVCQSCGSHGAGTFIVHGGRAVCNLCGEQDEEWQEEMLVGLGDQMGAQRVMSQKIVDRATQELVAAEKARKRLGPGSIRAYLEAVQFILRQQVVHMQAAGGCREGLEAVVWEGWEALLRSSEAVGRVGSGRPADTEEDAGKRFEESHYYFLELEAVSKEVPVESTLGALLLGCLIQQDAVLPHDLFWRAYTGDLPYLAAFRDLPDRLTQLLPKNSIQKLRPDKIPDPDVIMKGALRMAARAGIGPTVGFNVPALICRGVSELRLPSEVAKVAVGLYGLHLEYFRSFFEIPVERYAVGRQHAPPARNSPSCVLAAILLASLKLAFGLCEGRSPSVLARSHWVAAAQEPDWRQWALDAVQRLDDQVTSQVLLGQRGTSAAAAAAAVPADKLEAYLGHLKRSVFAGGQIPPLYTELASELTKIVDEDAAQASSHPFESDFVKRFKKMFPAATEGSGRLGSANSVANKSEYMIFDWGFPEPSSGNLTVSRLSEDRDFPMDFSMALTVVAAYVWHTPQDTYFSLVGLEQKMMETEGVTWPEVLRTDDRGRRRTRQDKKMLPCPGCGKQFGQCAPDCPRKKNLPKRMKVLRQEEEGADEGEEGGDEEEDEDEESMMSMEES